MSWSSIGEAQRRLFAVGASNPIAGSPPQRKRMPNETERILLELGHNERWQNGLPHYRTLHSNYPVGEPIRGRRRVSKREQEARKAMRQLLDPRKDRNV